MNMSRELNIKELNMWVKILGEKKGKGICEILIIAKFINIDALWLKF